MRLPGCRPATEPDEHDRRVVRQRDERPLDHHEVRAQVERERAVPFVGRRAGDAHAEAGADVEHDAVGRQARLVGHGEAAALLGRDVGDDDGRLAALLGDEAPRLLDRRLVLVDADDRRALAGGADGDGAAVADRRVGSRDGWVPAPTTAMQRPSSSGLTASAARTA